MRTNTLYEEQSSLLVKLFRLVSICSTLVSHWLQQTASHSLFPFHASCRREWTCTSVSFFLDSLQLLKRGRDNEAKWNSEDWAAKKMKLYLISCGTDASVFAVNCFTVQIAVKGAVSRVIHWMAALVEMTCGLLENRSVVNVRLRIFSLHMVWICMTW